MLPKTAAKTTPLLQQHHQIQEPQSPPLSPLYETPDPDLYIEKIESLKQYLPFLDALHTEALGFKLK